MIALPERGRIGIFNRSYYEECLVTRVHPELLAKEKIPARLVTKNIWRERFEDISAVRALPGAQRHRDPEVLPQRLEGGAARALSRPAGAAVRRTGSSRWTTSPSARCGTRYQAVYQDIVRHTSTPVAPWYVVPADHKWFARVVIGSTIVSALDKLDLQFPEGRQGLAGGIQAGARGAGERGQGRGEEGRRRRRLK